MPISFDGPTTTITLASGVGEVGVSEIYSRWKDWLKLSDNAKYLPAFRVIGGDPLTPTLRAGSFFFLRNDYGWKIKPPEENIYIQITGNLYPQDTGGANILAPTVGAFNTDIRLETSSLTQQVVISSGSGLSSTEQQMLLELWRRFGFDPANPVKNNPDGSFEVGGITVSAADLGGSILQSRS